MSELLPVDAVNALALEPVEVQRAVLKGLTRPQKRELLERWRLRRMTGSSRPRSRGGSG
jgi:hypothetical protein